MALLSRVIRITLKLFFALIAIYVLGNLLLLGGCLAMGVGTRASEIAAESAAELQSQLAKGAPMPPHVRLLVADDYAGWLPEPARPVDFDARLGWLSQDSGGRYMLTGRGLFDFSTAAQTALTCPAPRTGLASRRWLDDRRFIWDRCIFDLATLQPGTIERLWCGEGRSGCGGDELAVALMQIISQSDKIYRISEGDKEYVFVDLSDSGPPRAWTESQPFYLYSETKELVRRTAVETPAQEGRSIARGTSRPSPDGSFVANFDGKRLTITRAEGGTIIAQARIEDFHRFPGITYQHMSVAGWTDDSRQIIFLVETTFGSRRSLAQVFALTVPE